MVRDFRNYDTQFLKSMKIYRFLKMTEMTKLCNWITLATDTILWSLIVESERYNQITVKCFWSWSTLVDPYCGAWNIGWKCHGCFNRDIRSFFQIPKKEIMSKVSKIFRVPSRKQFLMASNKKCLRVRLKRNLCRDFLIQLFVWETVFLHTIWTAGRQFLLGVIKNRFLDWAPNFPML